MEGKNLLPTAGRFTWGEGDMIFYSAEELYPPKKAATFCKQGSMNLSTIPQRVTRKDLLRSAWSEMSRMFILEYVTDDAQSFSPFNARAKEKSSMVVRLGRQKKPIHGKLHWASITLDNFIQNDWNAVEA